MCYCVNTRHIWNRPYLFTPWFNNVICDKYLFLCILLQSNRKRSYQEIWAVKINVYVRNPYYFDLPKIRVDRARTTKKSCCLCLITNRIVYRLFLNPPFYEETSPYIAYPIFFKFFDFILFFSKKLIWLICTCRALVPEALNYMFYAKRQIYSRFDTWHSFC